MDFNSTKQGDFWVVVAKGRMDAVTAPEFEKECNAAMDNGENTFLADLGGLEYISSAGLRSILTTAKKLKASGGSISFCNLSGMVKEVFTISGFNAMFKMYDSVENALE